MTNFARRCVCTLLGAACAAMSGCVESNFVLEADSRWPAWAAHLPPAERGGTVTSTYRTGGVATFETMDSAGNRASWNSRVSCWHPRTRNVHHVEGNGASEEPHVIIVVVDGTVDVVEHVVRTNRFRMSDDLAILGEARESIARGECRTSP